MKEFLADKLNLCMMHTHLSTAYVLFLYIQDRAKHSCRSVSLRLLDLMAVEFVPAPLNLTKGYAQMLSDSVTMETTPRSVTVR